MTKEMDCCPPEQATTKVDPAATTVNRVRSLVLSPRGLTVSGIAVVAIGLALNWSWLVAVGAAPLILALAPCAVMCALGLCMMPRGNSPGTPAASDQPKMPAHDRVPPVSETALSHGIGDQHATLPN